MNKAVFLDRDGVINKVCYHDEKGVYSARDLREFELLSGVRGSIQRLKDAGFLVIVVSNQPGVAFGYIRKGDVEEINSFMVRDLGVDGVYNCFHHPEFTGECECRKPKPGLLLKASKDFDVDLSSSIMVGDNLSDVKAGEDCGTTLLVASKKSVDLLNLIESKGIKPTYIVGSLPEAVDIILSE